VEVSEPPEQFVVVPVLIFERASSPKYAVAPPLAVVRTAIAAVCRPPADLRLRSTPAGVNTGQPRPFV
jgi:hypothetical protein